MHWKKLDHSNFSINLKKNWKIHWEKMKNNLQKRNQMSYNSISNFFYYKGTFQDAISSFVVNNLQILVLRQIVFDLWMSKGEHDILALVINFLGVDWQPKHITFHLFKATNTNGQTLAKVWQNYWTFMDWRR